MKLAPKDPYEAMMCQYPGYRNRKQRRKADAIELKAHGSDPRLQDHHFQRVQKMKAVLSTRQRKRVEAWFDQFWDQIIAKEVDVLLPKNLRRYYDAVIKQYHVEMCMAADRRMLANAY